MAKFVYKDASVTINGVDLSDHVVSATVAYEADPQEDTAMGDNSRSRIMGLKDWRVDVRFHQDFDSGSVDETLFSLVGAAPFAIIVKPTSSAISATNPAFTGNVVLPSYNPLDGDVGNISTVAANFLGSGDLTRDVTP